MNDDRPRGELFKDPAAKVVWAGICALEEASQHDVLEALRTRLVVFDTRKGGVNQKRARAISALRHASARLGGKSPSVSEYRKLLRENQGLDWPSDGALRRALGGGWNAALEQAHLEPVAEPLAAEPALGPSFSDDELIHALQECARDVGETPSWTQYLHWVRRPDVTCRPGRRARAHHTFQRAFGGWHAALDAAGLMKDTIDGKPFTNGHKSMYSELDLFKAMDEISKRIGGGVPTVTEFSAVRRQIVAERCAAGMKGAERSFPSYNTCAMRFGRWNKFRDAYREWRKEQ